MENIVEANEKLVTVVKQLINKVKVLKEENSNLKNQLGTATQSLTLTDNEKAEIEKLLVETKEILEEDNPLVGQTV